MGLVGRNRALLCGTALAIFANVGMVQAQEDATTEQVTTESQKKGRVTQLQRLVLGAGQEKVAIDTPQAVTVVDQEEIDEAQPSTVSDVIKKVPGVNAAGSQRTLGQSFNIRGIGGSETAGEEGRIIINVDGAVKFYEQYRMGSLFTDPELYKRVEILRGPASSTLYGSGALGGVVNFTTKDASDFIEEGNSGALRLKTSYDSNGNGWLGSAIFAQKLSQNWDFLFAGNYRTQDSYKTGDGSLIRSSEVDAWSGLAKVTGKVGDEGTLRFSYQHWDSDAKNQDYVQIGGPPSAFFPGLPETIGGFGTVDRHVIDRTFVAAYENPFSDNDLLDLKIALTYSNTAVEQRNASGIPAVGFVCPTNPGMPPSTPSMFCDTDFGYNTWQLKVENTSTWQGANWENHLTYGWQTSHQTRVAEAWDADGDAFIFPFHPEGSDFKTGVYVQNEFIWNDKLTLIPGVRVDWRQLTPGDNFPPAYASSDKADDWAFSPKLAALYKFNDTFSVFGSYAHTERFPTLDETFQWDFGQSYSLKKERSDNFELGFAVSRFDIVQPGDALQFKATGFYNDVKDMIVSCRSGNSCGLPGTYPDHYQNVERATIYGAEFELAYDSDYFFLNAGYSHVRGERHGHRDATAGEYGYLNTVAPHELKLGIGGKLPEHGIRFGWNARFVAGPQDPKRNTDIPPDNGSTRYSTSFNVHDIFVSWKPTEGKLFGWEAQAGIDNIFNEQYKEFLMNEPAKGRTFKLSLSKQFGW